MDTKKIARDVIGLIIIIAAAASLFWPVVSTGAEELIRFLAGTVIGYYFGAGSVPVIGAIKKK